MKRVLLVLLAAMFSMSTFAQGKQKGKQKKHQHDKQCSQNGNHAEHVSYKNGGAKSAKNVPASVRKAFQADFPQASRVTWTKSQGYWTANFRSGINRRSVTYHANGRRSGTGYDQAQTLPQPTPSQPRFPW